MQRVARIRIGLNFSRIAGVYADTSVFGGVFDEEFTEASKEFFDEVWDGRFALVTSAVVQAELEPAPKEVQMFFDEILEVAEVTEVTAEALVLRDAYLRAGILGTKYTDDALHVGECVRLSRYCELELPAYCSL